MTKTPVLPFQPALPIRPALPFRNDTLLGVCEGLGRDLGIHPNLLRIAFASAFYFSPTIVIATYLALGLIVAASRYAFPDRAIVAAAEVQVPVANDAEAMKLAA